MSVTIVFQFMIVAKPPFDVFRPVRIVRFFPRTRCHRSPSSIAKEHDLFLSCICKWKCKLRALTTARLGGQDKADFQSALPSVVSICLHIVLVRNLVALRCLRNVRVFEGFNDFKLQTWHGAMCAPPPLRHRKFFHAALHSALLGPCSLSFGRRSHRHGEGQTRRFPYQAWPAA